jgi:hypothetical protein
MSRSLAFPLASITFVLAMLGIYHVAAPYVVTHSGIRGTIVILLAIFLVAKAIDR